MISEMTMSYEITLPLMLACVSAYTVARVFRPESIYAASLRRQEQAQTGGVPMHTSVGGLLKPDRRPVLRPDMSLVDLAQTFSHHRVQYLYLVDEQQAYLGAVSLHDVAQALAHRTEPPPRARDLILRDFPVLTSQMNLGEALQIFAQHQRERLPVLSEGAGPRRLLGAVSKTDVMLLLMGQAPQRGGG
jgi:CIC family chloride channel protein